MLVNLRKGPAGLQDQSRYFSNIFFLQRLISQPFLKVTV